MQICHPCRDFLKKTDGLQVVKNENINHPFKTKLGYTDYST